jgi:hypothetical protein
MQRLSTNSHGNVGSYLHDALHEGSARVPMLFHVSVFLELRLVGFFLLIFPFLGVDSNVFSCKEYSELLVDMQSSASCFADGGKVHQRTGLKLCTSKRQAVRETLTTRPLPVALTLHATPKSLLSILHPSSIISSALIIYSSRLIRYPYMYGYLYRSTSRYSSAAARHHSAATASHSSTTPAADFTSVRLFVKVILHPGCIQRLYPLCIPS